MATKSTTPSLLEDKVIKSALKEKGLSGSDFPTLQELGVRLPEQIPNTPEGKNKLKTEIQKEIDTKLQKYAAELVEGKQNLIQNYLYRALGADNHDAAFHNLEISILKGNVRANVPLDRRDHASSEDLQSICSKEKFYKHFDNQSNILTNMHYKSSAELASLRTLILQIELADMLGIKLDPKTKKALEQAKHKISESIKNSKLPHKDEMSSYLRAEMWKSFQAEFNQMLSSAGTDLQSKKFSDPKTYQSLEQKAKGQDMPEIDVSQPSKVFSPSFNQHKEGNKAPKQNQVESSTPSETVKRKI